jgi:hypothetical protein
MDKTLIHGFFETLRVLATGQYPKVFKKIFKFFFKIKGIIIIINK